MMTFIEKCESGCTHKLSVTLVDKIGRFASNDTQTSTTRYTMALLP